MALAVALLGGGKSITAEAKRNSRATNGVLAHPVGLIHVKGCLNDVSISMNDIRARFATSILRILKRSKCFEIDDNNNVDLNSRAFCEIRHPI